MKTPTPSTDDPAQEDLLQKYHERVERLPQQNHVIKFCTDAGFLTTIDIGQYFMTKDTDKLSIQKLSQQDRVSKFCTDAGFLIRVEVGQYFMTKDTE